MAKKWDPNIEDGTYVITEPVGKRSFDNLLIWFPQESLLSQKAKFGIIPNTMLVPGTSLEAFAMMSDLVSVYGKWIFRAYVTETRLAYNAVYVFARIRCDANMTIALKISDFLNRKMDKISPVDRDEVAVMWIAQDWDRIYPKTSQELQLKYTNEADGKQHCLSYPERAMVDVLRDMLPRGTEHELDRQYETKDSTPAAGVTSGDTFSSHNTTFCGEVEGDGN